MLKGKPAKRIKQNLLKQNLVRVFMIVVIFLEMFQLEKTPER